MPHRMAKAFPPESRSLGALLDDSLSVAVGSQTLLCVGCRHRQVPGQKPEIHQLPFVQV